jgi:ABC-type antimicrobial peptide transport system permease subunit
MVDGVTWPTTLPPGWTVEWDIAHFLDTDDIDYSLHFIL